MNKKILNSLLLSEAKVDKTTGIISGVHLMGMQSANSVGDREPYKYTEASFISATDKYVGKPVNLNHGFPSVEAKIGVILSDVQHRAGKGLFGSIQLNVEHPMAKTVMWWAENHPRQISMSHVAYIKYDEDTNSVVEIQEVESVDVVHQGATTNGLFSESADDKTKISTILDRINTLVAESVLAPMKVVLDPKETAVKYLAVLEQTLANLTNKDQTMDYKDLTIDLLSANRADLVEKIRESATSDLIALQNKVQEAVKDIAVEHRSKVFMESIETAIKAGKDVKDLVDDRKALTESIVSAGAAKLKPAPSTKPLTDADILSAF